MHHASRAAHDINLSGPGPDHRHTNVVRVINKDFERRVAQLLSHPTSSPAIRNGVSISSRDVLYSG